MRVLSGRGLWFSVEGKGGGIGGLLRRTYVETFSIVKEDVVLLVILLQ